MSWISSWLTSTRKGAGVPCAADAETAAEAGRRNVPLLALAGDDVWTPAGTRALRGADALVRAYRDAGGDNCRVFGKPHVHFFKEAAKLAERHGACTTRRPPAAFCCSRL